MASEDEKDESDIVTVVDIPEKIMTNEDNENVIDVEKTENPQLTRSLNQQSDNIVILEVL